MDSLIENYINGNLTEAKRQARHYSGQQIADAFADYGYKATAAVAIAGFLKGILPFQTACDVEYSERAATQ